MKAASTTRGAAELRELVRCDVMLVELEGAARTATCHLAQPVRSLRSIGVFGADPRALGGVIHLRHAPHAFGGMLAHVDIKTHIHDRTGVQLPRDGSYLTKS